MNVRSTKKRETGSAAEAQMLPTVVEWPQEETMAEEREGAVKTMGGRAKSRVAVPLEGETGMSTRLSSNGYREQGPSGK